MACIVAPLAPYSWTRAASLPPATERGWCSSAPLTKLIAVRRGAGRLAPRAARKTVFLLHAFPFGSLQLAAGSWQPLRARPEPCTSTIHVVAKARLLLLFHDRACLVSAAAAGTTCRRAHVCNPAQRPTALLQQPFNAPSSRTAVSCATWSTKPICRA